MTEETKQDVHPIAFDELDGSQMGAQLGVNMSPLHKLKAQVVVRVGSAELTVGELMSLREQQLVVLNCHINGPVDVMVEGGVIAQGELVAVGDRFAVRVTHLPEFLKG